MKTDCRPATGACIGWPMPPDPAHRRMGRFHSQTRISYPHARHSLPQQHARASAESMMGPLTGSVLSLGWPGPTQDVSHTTTKIWVTNPRLLSSPRSLGELTRAPFTGAHQPITSLVTIYGHREEGEFSTSESPHCSWTLSPLEANGSVLLVLRQFCMTVIILLVWCLYYGEWKISDVFFMIWLPLALHVLTAWYSL
jgi:hypothetical protein